MKTLAIAAGGGGDAITAAVLADKLPSLDVAAIMTYSWDRLLVDPVPGPRAADDFDGLIEHAPEVFEVPATAMLRGGQSTIPPLARHIRQPLLLLDIQSGTVGLARQIERAAAAVGADRLTVVDVGGDILADGDEDGLRSPLADSVALAGAVTTDLPVTVLVAGVGLDGELRPDDLRKRLDFLGAEMEFTLAAGDVAPFKEIWEWHPSEASGLVAAAASGWRGIVETQRAEMVEVTAEAACVYRVDAYLLAGSSLAALVSDSTSLDEIETLFRDRRGYSDIDVERRKLATISAQSPLADPLGVIDQYAELAVGRGVDALTLRRVFELVRAIDPESSGALRRTLMEVRADRVVPPLYLTVGGR